MNKNRYIGAGKYLFTGVLALVTATLLILAPKSAVNVDEMLHYPHAKDVVNWYFTGGEDQSCLNTPQTNLKYYGQSVDNFTALFNRVFLIENEFLVRHYTGAFFFLLLLVVTGLLAREVTGSWVVAAFTVIALALMPRLAGQAFGNLKDIPFATGYVAGLLMIVRFFKEFPHPRWKTALLLGAAIAFTVSVRAGGYILFAYLGLVFLVYFALRPFYLIKIVSTKPVFVRLLGQGTAILMVGYFTGLLFWPYALQNVFINPFESLQVMEHYKVSIRQVFDGELMWSTQLPWYYLPKWLMISSPLFVLAGFAVYLCFFTIESISSQRISRQTLLEGFVLFAFAFPMVYVIAIGSNLYSGIRQMMFIVPPMILLSVWGIYKLLVLFEKKNKVVFYAFTFLFSISLFWPIKHQAATFPVDYVYFNQLAGGNNKAWGNYEYDYYFHGIKEAVDLLEEMNSEEEIIVAMNCNLSNYFNGNPGIIYQYTRYLERSSVDWDYGIFGLNYLDPDFLKNDRWKPAGEIRTFFHLGNPVAVLVRRQDKSDFYGISEIKSGNLHHGATILERTIQDQKNNVWLYVNMANAKFELGEKDEFLYYIGEGKKIHPSYEPLLLLEASNLYTEKNYNKAYQKLLELLKINPRYLPAKDLYEEVIKELEKQN